VTPTFIARASPWRTGVNCLLCCGIAIVALWFAGVFGRQVSSAELLGGWLAAIASAGVAIYAFSQLFDTTVQVKICSVGIYVKSYSDETIPWVEIEHITHWKRNPGWIVLHLVDPKKFQSKPVLHGATAAVATGGHVPITMAGINGSLDEAMAAILTFQPRLLS
jgi:hypothetical protein